MSEKSASLLGELSSELEKCRRLSVETPLVNPYQQLSYRMLKQMKAGDLPSAELDELLADLGAESFLSRARRARAYVQETDRQKNRAQLTACFERLVKGKTFAEFQAIAG
ncbi:MAG TPA: hypothetical protein ENI91_00765, partial [Sphingomonadales bacterium]|nr:hypothetical protein [Sphingomonadales bacterium]